MASIPKILAAGTADVLVHTGRCKLAGFYGRSTVAGVTVLRDGIDATGTPVLELTFPAAGTVGDHLPDVVFTQGIFVDRDGTVNHSLTLFLAQGV